MKAMNSVVGRALVAASLLVISTVSFANYPSPTGWRGPIREAGRPWLNGTAYQPRRVSRQSAPAVVWYAGESSDYVWTLDNNTGLYWYYFPATGQYASRPSR